MEFIRAAGGVLWREGDSGQTVALVHRPRRRDWSLPKGKLEDGEGWEEAAIREVREETGCEARLLGFVGAACYPVKGRPKVVLYWSMALLRQGTLEAADEVDEVAWLPAPEALLRLTHPSEREILGRAAGLRARCASP